MGKVKLSLRDMALCSLFTSLISVGAFIKIPLPGMPFTLQVMFTTLSGLLAGRCLGMISTGLYMVLGLLGLPVFTAGSGFGYILQPTFGYIIGFILGAGLAGSIVERSRTKSFKVMLAASFANLAVIYTTGVIYYYFIAAYYSGSRITASFLMIQCVLLTIPGDILCCILDAVLAARLRKVLKVLK